MNRTEFLAELERLLEGMPEEERQAAVQYYADYLADAGVENEADAIRELGSPEKVAETIRADYYGTEFNEEDYDQKDYMERYSRSSSDSGAEDRAGQQKPWTSGKIKLLIVLLIIIAVWPVSLGAAVAVLAVAAVVICFFPVLAIAAAAVMLSGGFVFVLGIALMFIPAAGMIVVGVGILLFVAGLIATVGAVKLCTIVYPAMLRGFVNLCRRPFYGKAV